MIATSRPPLIEKLQHKLLHDPLPGPSAHSKMAHAVRRVEPVQDIGTTKDAAVLLTLFEKNPNEWHLIFIRRTSSHQQDKHAGQVGFPGGKWEESDPDLMYTALRETEEEIAIDLSGIDVLGPLSPLYITVSKFLVHPYLAYSWKTPQLMRQESEIEEILEIPLSSFLQPASRKDTRINLTTGIILNHVPSFQVNGHTIWGATAMILSELLDILPA
ncbi:MAG: CoA pyrophosphatase [Saprospiraceae bacterium]|nr:CoA pyrophosphatase [Saprospiraceae bacterium]